MQDFSISIDFGNIWFLKKHLFINEDEDSSNLPISFENFGIFENEPAKKKTTLAPPFLPMEKQLSSEDFFMKNYAKKW